MESSKYEGYLNTYAGKSLLKEYSLDAIGIWRIYGEDPNCDLGGAHIQPDLGMVEGKLRDVIEYAVDLPGFWTWGAGGNIKLVERIKKIDPVSIKRRKELEEAIRSAESTLSSLKKQLEEL